MYLQKRYSTTTTSYLSAENPESTVFDRFITADDVLTFLLYLELEDYVFCGPSCEFTNDLTPRAKYPKGSAGYKKTKIREGASIVLVSALCYAISFGVKKIRG